MIDGIIQIAAKSAKETARMAELKVPRHLSGPSQSVAKTQCPHCGAPQKTRENRCDYCGSIFSQTRGIARGEMFINPEMFGKYASLKYDKVFVQEIKDGYDVRESFRRRYESLHLR